MGTQNQPHLRETHMREILQSGLSAAALLGVASVYKYSKNQSRARRDIGLPPDSPEPLNPENFDYKDFSEEEEDKLTTFQHEELDAGISDDIGTNITESEWLNLQLDLGMQESEIIPFELSSSAESKQAGMYAGMEYIPEGGPNGGGGSPLRNGGGRRKNNQANIKRFKLRDIPQLHEKMIQTFHYRKDQLLKMFLSDTGIKAAEKYPVVQAFDKGYTGETDTSHHHRGFNDTNPAIQKFLDEFGYKSDGSNLFKEGQYQFWFLLPAAVPLFTDDANGHVLEYKGYWKFITSFAKAFDFRKKGGLRLSIGLYHKGAVYSPRGAIYRPGRFPWSRVAAYYARPRATTSMPFIIPTANTLLNWLPRFGASSPSAGQDCFTFWFHQDFAADADQLLIPEQFAKLDEVYAMCTVMHIFVGHDQYDPVIQAYASALMPGYQTKVAKDPDFSGIFFAKHLSDLGTPEFVQAVFKYITLVKSRVACRLHDKGYVSSGVPDEGTMVGGTFEPGTDVPTVSPGDEFTVDPDSLLTIPVEPTGVEGFRGINGFYTVAPTVGDGDRYRFQGYATVHSTIKLPEIDSCCGHGIFTGTPYDSELRTCCDDGKPRAFSDDGSDPCQIGIGLDDYNY